MPPKISDHHYRSGHYKRNHPGDENSSKSPPSKTMRTRSSSGIHAVKKKVLPTVEPLKKMSDTWTVVEKATLADALRDEGFNNTQLLAEKVQTKNAQQVENFINKRTKDLMERNKDIYKHACANVFNTKNNLDKSLMSSADNYMPVTYWSRIVRDLCSSKIKNGNSSKVLFDFFEVLENEEPECTDPTMPDFKRMYKFFKDLYSGNNPALLAQKDLLPILIMMDEVDDFIQKHDFSLEEQFIKDFPGPTKFIPMNVDENCNKCPAAVKPEIEKAPKGINYNDKKYKGLVSIPLDQYEDIMKHRRIKEHLNPMMVHPDLLNKGQEQLRNYFEQFNIGL